MKRQLKKWMGLLLSFMFLIQPLTICAEELAESETNFTFVGAADDEVKAITVPGNTVVRFADDTSLKLQDAGDVTLTAVSEETDETGETWEDSNCTKGKSYKIKALVDGKEVATFITEENAAVDEIIVEMNVSKMAGINTAVNNYYFYRWNDTGYDGREYATGCRW